MTEQEISFKLSCNLSSIVRTEYLVERYGIGSCKDIMAGGDLYDTYIAKIFVDSMFTCDDIFKTN